MDTKLQAILYILNCNEALRTKILPYIQLTPNSIHWDFIRELPLSRTEQRLVIWMERLSVDERLELDSEMRIGGALEIDPYMPREMQRICLKAFAIRSGWGINIRKKSDS